MKYISEKEAWELCGEYFSLELEDRREITPYANLIHGICLLIELLSDKHFPTISNISQKTYKIMHDRINEFMGGAEWLCEPNYYRRPDFLRATFCYLMAEACEDM